MRMRIVDEEGEGESAMKRAKGCRGIADEEEEESVIDEEG